MGCMQGRVGGGESCHSDMKYAPPISEWPTRLHGPGLTLLALWAGGSCFPGLKSEPPMQPALTAGHEQSTCLSVSSGRQAAPYMASDQRNLCGCVCVCGT